MKPFTKYCRWSFLFLLVAVLKSNSGNAQTVVFYFVAPSNIISASFPGALNATGCPAGYAKVKITGPNVAIFNNIAPPNIKYAYTQLQPGTDLRKNLNSVMLNSNGLVRTIEYWLADDRTSFNVPGNGNNAGVFSATPEVNPKYVWPAAFNYKTSGNVYIGIVGLGEHELQVDISTRPGGMSAIDEVILHESSHTQFMDGSKWDGVGGLVITYGSDGEHYSRGELLADQEGALDEGLATFYGFIMNNAGLQELIDDYSNAGYRYFVEASSFMAGQQELYSIAGRKTNVLFHKNSNNVLVPNLYKNGDEVTIYSYKWKMVPSWYLLFNEGISTLFFSFFRNETYSNKETSLSMIRFTSQAMSPDRRKRFLTYACNRLALKMEEYNDSPAGRADASRTSSLFPFAVLDLLTHFDMTDADYQVDYRRNNADRDPKAYREYFLRRAAIKALVLADLDASPIRFDQALKSIVAYCKVPANIL